MKSSQAKSRWLCVKNRNSRLIEPEASEKLSEQADNYLQSLVDNKKFIGSVLLARNGEIFLNKGYGCSEYVSHEQNGSRTIYRIGSITKTFTATIVLRLYERKLLKLKNKLSMYCPDYPRGNEITIKHLLSNTSGIEDYTDLEIYEKKCEQELTLEQLIDLFRNEPLKFKPGSRYDYSNSNFILLGLVIEKVTGKSYEANLRELILEPCSMKDTGYESNNNDFLTDEKHLKRAYGYVCNENGNGFQNCRFIDMSTARSAGGIYSTIEDLYRFDRYLHGKKLLKESTKKLMFKPVRDNYALGWSIRRTDGGRIQQEHTGQIFGFTSILVRFPRENSCIIVLSNLEETSVETVVDRLSDILFQENHDT